MQALRKIISGIFFIIWGMTCFSFPVQAAKTSANPSLVIALDPGHGGSQLRKIKERQPLSLKNCCQSNL